MARQYAAHRKESWEIIRIMDGRELTVSYNLSSEKKAIEKAKKLSEKSPVFEYAVVHVETVRRRVEHVR